MRYILGIFSFIAIIFSYFKGKSSSDKNYQNKKLKTKQIQIENEIKEHEENMRIKREIENNINNSAYDIISKLRKKRKDNNKK